MGIKLLSSLEGSQNTQVDSCFVTSTQGISASGLTKTYVPTNVTADTCGIHVGNNTEGLFFGNSTTNGFVPKIKGVAFDVTDAGISLIGGVAVDSGSGGAIQLVGATSTGGTVTNRALVDFYNNTSKVACINASGHIVSACFCGALGGAATSANNAICFNSLQSTQFLRSDAADVKTTGNLTFNDNICATFGTSNDLMIRHNGTLSQICNITGDLYIDNGSANEICMRIGTTLDSVMRAVPDSCVSLYYDNAEKLKTLTNGACTLGNHYTSGNNCAGNVHTNGQVRANADVAGEGVVISASGVTANAHGLVDFVENVNNLYGFQLCMDGGANQFYIGRKDNSATSTKVMCINRASNTANFAGDICTTGDLISGDDVCILGSAVQAPSRVSFLNGGAAQAASFGNILASSSFACAACVPSQGIWAAGLICTASNLCATGCVRGSFVYSQGQSCAASCMVSPQFCANAGGFKVFNSTDRLCITAAAGGSSCVSGASYVLVKGLGNGVILYHGSTGRVTTSTLGATITGVGCGTTCLKSPIICSTTCGTGPDWVSTSDGRLKSCYENIEDPIELTMGLCGKKFCMCGQEGKQFGFVAQEVEKTIPEVVSKTKVDGTQEDLINMGITDQLYGIKYNKVVPILVEAFKQQRKELLELKEEVERLKQ